MPRVRKTAGFLKEVCHVQVVLQEARVLRGNSRRNESQLVTRKVDMQNTDPIADFLTRVRNAQKAKHASVNIPASKMKERISEILKREGYIKDFDVVANKGVEKTISIKLKYDLYGKPLIREISRISKPGNRCYKSLEELSTMRDVVSTAILSTSKGIMTDQDAVQQKVGGELICRIS